MQLSPLNTQGFALLGEMGSKLLPVSTYRIVSASARADARCACALYDVVVNGAAGETVTIGALVPNGSGGMLLWQNATVNASGQGLVRFRSTQAYSYM
eukprot:COSAG02_NODE_7045_length_3209_cov_5513.444908_1_plen_98_part_00